MIQDIGPSKLNNSYVKTAPLPDDTVMAFDGEGKVLADANGGIIRFPTEKEIHSGNAIYLFGIDENRYFLDLGNNEGAVDGYERYDIRKLRDSGSGKELFAAFTAYHLWKWYAANIYCGRCKSPLVPDEKERALRCPGCGNIIYPRINPAVIVGVTSGDSILITRYRSGYAHNALIAGFCEIGETLEETVRREVMEEAGIRVKNIRYYKSQPWGMAEDLLMGFYCEADGDTDIHMDEGELKYAEWTKRSDIALQPSDISLTNEMMRMFKENRE